MVNQPMIYTIGHSTRTIEEFISLLQENSIDVIADVRSSPYSRHMPHFSRQPLAASLKEAGIQYVFLGQELGARRDEKDCYVNGVARYDLIEKAEAFTLGIERLKKGAASYRIALMCAERDPLTCHRTILVARHLMGDYQIQHIVGPNDVRSQSQLERSLLSRWNMDQPELFTPGEEQLAEAYQRQADKIAYRVPPAETSENGEVTAGG